MSYKYEDNFAWGFYSGVKTGSSHKSLLGRQLVFKFYTLDINLFYMSLSEYELSQKLSKINIRPIFRFIPLRRYTDLWKWWHDHTKFNNYKCYTVIIAVIFRAKRAWLQLIKNIVGWVVFENYANCKVRINYTVWLKFKNKFW